jgi:TPR repeat protein
MSSHSLFARLDNDSIQRILVAAADINTIDTLSLLNNTVYETLFVANVDAYGSADQKNLYFLRGKKALADYRHNSQEDWFSAYRYFIQSYDLRYPERQWVIDNFECLIICNTTTTSAEGINQARTFFALLMDFFKEVLADTRLSTESQAITYYLMGRAIYHHAASCYGVFGLNRFQPEQSIVQHYLEQVLEALEHSMRLGCHKAFNLQFEIYTGLNDREQASRVLALLQQYAVNHDTHAQFHAGQIYHDKWWALTEGIDADALCQEVLLKALRYLSHAAEKRHVTAQVRLMSFTMNPRYQARLQSPIYSSLRTQIDNYLAKLVVYQQQFLNACYQGHLEAQFERAILHLYAIDTHIMSEEPWRQALALFQQPSERNYIYAQIRLYRHSDSANITNPQQAQVFTQAVNDYWLLQLAHNGFAALQYKLAVKLAQRSFTAISALDEEQQQPRYWYEKAAALTASPVPNDESKPWSSYRP